MLDLTMRIEQYPMQWRDAMERKIKTQNLVQKLTEEIEEAQWGCPIPVRPSKNVLKRAEVKGKIEKLQQQVREVEDKVESQTSESSTQEVVDTDPEVLQLRRELSEAKALLTELEQDSEIFHYPMPPEEDESERAARLTHLKEQLEQAQAEAERAYLDIELLYARFESYRLLVQLK